MAVKLTNSNWETLKLPADGPSEKTVSDPVTKGLFLRLRRGKDGTAGKWVYRFRPATIEVKKKAAPVSIAIGDRTGVSLKEARAKAAQFNSTLAAELDPRTAKSREQAEANDRVLKTLIDAYSADMARRGVVNRDSITRTITRACSAWLTRDVQTISKAEWTNLGNRLGDDARQRLTTFTGFVTDAGHLDANPLLRARGRRKSRAEMLAEKAKRGQLDLGGVSGRVLSDAELVSIWRATDSQNPFDRLTRFQLLTGCRRNEAAGLRYEWDHGDWLEFPAEFMKAGRAWRVFVTPMLREVIGPHQPGRTGLVFKSLRGPRVNKHLDEVPVSGFSKLHKALMARSEVEGWSSHCLRKTLITRLREDESREDVRSLVGQKTSTDRLDDSYDLRDFSSTQRRLAVKWTDRIEAIVSGDSVSPVRLVAAR